PATVDPTFVANVSGGAVYKIALLSDGKILMYVTPGPGLVGGTNDTYVLSNGHYTLPELRGSTVVTGRATLYVSGSAQPYTIVIRREASLDLYVAGASASFGPVMNENGNAVAFAYYGLPGNTNVSVHGNNFFVGTFYAPAA